MNEAPWSASAFMAATGSSALAKQFLDQRIVLVEKAPGGVVVLGRQLGAGQTIIGGRYIDQRYPDLRRRLMQVADLDFQRLIGRNAHSARSRQDADGNRKPEQVVASHAIFHDGIPAAR